MKQNKYIDRLYRGIIKENPTLVIMLGLCPTLAVTTSARNGIYMGLTTMAVLIFSNLFVSALRNVIPDKVRIPSYIVIAASVVTIVERLLQAYLPSLNEILGIYLPLIVVNCIIMGRAEAYAAKNDIGLSVFDGIGMGLGFTGALTILGAVRELLGVGSLFGIRIMPSGFEPMQIFVLAPGAFFVIAILTALQNKLQAPSATNRTSEDVEGGCTGCSGCGSGVKHQAEECGKNSGDTSAEERQEERT